MKLTKLISRLVAPVLLAVTASTSYAGGGASPYLQYFKPDTANLNHVRSGASWATARSDVLTKKLFQSVLQ